MNKVIEDRTMKTYHCLKRFFKNDYDITIIDEDLTYSKKIKLISNHQVLYVYVESETMWYKTSTRGRYKKLSRVINSFKISEEIKFLYKTFSKYNE